MKILLGILVIVLAVFLNSVELGTPLGGGFPLRPGSAPRPVPVPGSSGGKQSGRGGRQGRRQGGRAIQPAAARAAAPRAPPTAAPRAPAPIIRTQETMGETTYIAHPLRGYIKLSETAGLDVTLVQNGWFFIGIIIGDDVNQPILPIFDEQKNMIRIDIKKNFLPITMGKTVARRWGVFEKYADFCEAHPLAFTI